MKTKLLITVLALSFSATALAQREEAPPPPAIADLVEGEMNRTVEDEGEEVEGEDEEEDGQARSEESGTLEEAEMDHAAQENPVFIAPAEAQNNIIGQ